MTRLKVWPLQDPIVEGPIIAEIETQTDRASALIAAEFVSQRLKEAMSALFKHSWKDREKDLFSGQGPLATFSARINMSHAFGVVGPETHRDLHLIRKIRNEFAHNIAPISFTDASISARCRELVLPDHHVVGTHRPTGYVISEARDRYLFSASFVMSRLLGFTRLRESHPHLSELP